MTDEELYQTGLALGSRADGRDGDQRLPNGIRLADERPKGRHGAGQRRRDSGSHLSIRLTPLNQQFCRVQSLEFLKWNDGK